MAVLGRPPLPDPNIQSQEGIPPEEPVPEMGMGSLAARRPGPGAVPAGAPDPNGAIVSQSEAIKKVLEQMGKTEPMMAPFAARCAAILDAGVAAVRTAPKATDLAGEMGTPGENASPAAAGSPADVSGLPPMA